MTVTTAHGDAGMVGLHEHVARVRRSIVAVRAGAHAATGWVALSNGMVVTSRRGIGYPTEVALSFEDGRSRSGRVISVDVHRDVSLLLPFEGAGVAGLPVRSPGDPRLGERVALLSCLPGQSLRLFVARICQVRKSEGGLPMLELDAVAPLGAAVLDAEGRVIGTVVSVAGPGGALPGHCEALMVGSLHGLLSAVDRPAGELKDRSPVYRCPACDDPFDLEHDRCLACGRLLPHAFTPSAERAAAERLIRQSLSSLGFVANRARVSPTAWRVAQRSYPSAEMATQVDINLDELGSFVTLRSPVVGLPAANHEPFYRFLLTMNDQTTGEFRVSVTGDEVSVSCVAALEGTDHDVAQLIDELVQMADEYRRTLADTFDAVPRFESSGSW